MSPPLSLRDRYDEHDPLVSLDDLCRLTGLTPAAVRQLRARRRRTNVSRNLTARARPTASPFPDPIPERGRDGSALWTRSAVTNWVIATCRPVDPVELLALYADREGLVAIPTAERLLGLAPGTVQRFHDQGIGPRTWTPPIPTRSDRVPPIPPRAEPPALITWLALTHPEHYTAVILSA